MIITIRLTKEESSFLNLFLHEKGFRDVIWGKEETPTLIMDSDLANDVRNYLGEELPNHFDSMYNITQTGSLIESIIDKLTYV